MSRVDETGADDDVVDLTPQVGADGSTKEVGEAMLLVGPRRSLANSLGPAGSPGPAIRSEVDPLQSVAHHRGDEFDTRPRNHAQPDEHVGIRRRRGP